MLFVSRIAKFQIVGGDKMFERILVPLDGSKLAECALPYTETLAKNCSTTEVVLISVTEKMSGTVDAVEVDDAFIHSDKGNLGEVQSGASSTAYLAPSGNVSSIDNIGKSGSTIKNTYSFGKLERQADKYLARIEKKLKAKGIPVKSEVLIGKPAERITKYAEDNKIDLIIMASHGRSGPSRWAMGSVSDKVFRAACIPVLMVRAPGCFPGI